MSDQAKLAAIREEIDGYIDGAPDAGEASRLANRIALILDGASVAQSATQLQELKRAKREVQELREALEAMMDGSKFCGYDGEPPMWQSIRMPSEEALNKARQALARPAHPEELADKGGA